MTKVNLESAPIEYTVDNDQQLINKETNQQKVSIENSFNETSNNRELSESEFFALHTGADFSRLQRVSLEAELNQQVRFDQFNDDSLGEESPVQDTELIGLSNSSTDDTFPFDPENPGRIARLQRLLIQNGALTEETVGSNWGIFGDNTEQAVKDFQRQWGLSQTGVVDETTARYLENPPNRAELGPQRRDEIREQVRQAAINQYAQQYPDAPLGVIEAAGDRAVREFDEQIQWLVNDEMNQYLAANPGLRLNNLPAEDRAELEAIATYAAVERYQLSQNALNSSFAEMNGTTEAMDNVNIDAQDATEWKDYCQAFVSTAYDYRIEDMRVGSASAAIETLRASGQLRESGTQLNEGEYPDFSNVPAGAAVYFNRNPDGHVAIFTGEFTSDGEPIIRTSGYYLYDENKQRIEGTGRDGITDMPFSEMVSEFGLDYVGYVPYPDPNPNGF